MGILSTLLSVFSDTSVKAAASYLQHTKFYVIKDLS